MSIKRCIRSWQNIYFKKGNFFCGTHPSRIHKIPIVQWRRDRTAPIAVQTAQRPQRHRMHGRHQDAVERAQSGRPER